MSESKKKNGSGFRSGRTTDTGTTAGRRTRWLTFESAGRSLPVDHAVVQQPSTALRQVLPAEHAAVFDFPLRLWLHLAADVLQSTAFLVQVDQGVDLHDGVLDQGQRAGQVLVLRCSRWTRRERGKKKNTASLDLMVFFLFFFGCFSGCVSTAGPSVLLRMRSTRTGYFVMRCVTSRMHSGTPSRRTMDKLFTF